MTTARRIEKLEREQEDERRRLIRERLPMLIERFSALPDSLQLAREAGYASVEDEAMGYLEEMSYQELTGGLNLQQQLELMIKRFITQAGRCGIRSTNRAEALSYLVKTMNESEDPALYRLAVEEMARA